ncbi:MAG: hypothetical protein VZR11_04590 [Succinimonas sp.]|nr:hypothetical protein [Succinimonas sp.]
MKKLLLAVFAFSLACNAIADDYDDAREVYDSLLQACMMCDSFDSRCRSQVNLTKSNIVASRPGLTRAYSKLKSFRCM